MFFLLSLIASVAVAQSTKLHILSVKEHVYNIVDVETGKTVLKRCDAVDSIIPNGQYLHPNYKEILLARKGNTLYVFNRQNGASPLQTFYCKNTFSISQIQVLPDVQDDQSEMHLVQLNTGLITAYINLRNFEISTLQQQNVVTHYNRLRDRLRCSYLDSYGWVSIIMDAQGKHITAPTPQRHLFEVGTGYVCMGWRYESGDTILGSPGYGIVDFDGNTLCDFKYHNIRMSVDGYLIVTSASNWSVHGVIDETGKVIVPVRYHSAAMSNGEWRTQLYSRYGVFCFQDTSSKSVHLFDIAGNRLLATRHIISVFSLDFDEKNNNDRYLILQFQDDDTLHLYDVLDRRLKFVGSTFNYNVSKWSTHPELRMDRFVTHDATGKYGMLDLRNERVLLPFVYLTREDVLEPKGR